jgi:acetyltransferase
MMEQTTIYTALKGVRGRRSVDMPALEQMMVRFSELVVEQPWIKEIDINPLLASSDRLVALDARVVVHGPEVKEENLPKLAIRPYPVQYCSTAKLKDGGAVSIRPIRPEDEPLMVKFHETLSERTVYQRYLHMMKLSQRVAHERLTRICFIDYDREMALIALHEGNIIGVARIRRVHGSKDVEFAVIITDDYQGKGIGTELVRRMLDVAREEGCGRVVADILPDNLVMQRICEKLGFRIKRSMDDPVVKVELELAVPV